MTAFSYPFGEKKDCLASKELLEKTNEYQMAFTVEKIVNTVTISPFTLGRYQPVSTDDASHLHEILNDIIKQEENP